MTKRKITGMHLALVFFILLSAILGMSTYKMYQRSLKLTLMLNEDRAELFEITSDLKTAEKELKKTKEALRKARESNQSKAGNEEEKSDLIE